MYKIIVTGLLLATNWLYGATPVDNTTAGPRDEFARYYKQITGKDVPSGLITYALNPTLAKNGYDAYRIQSLPTGGVAVSGANLRALYYAVYDLLERRGGCHWFWDGDVVPKRATLDLTGLDVQESARFEYRAIRYFAHRGLTRFQAEHWGFEDWKREIDWALKRRLNVLMLRIGQDDLFQRAFPETCTYPDVAKDLPGHGKGYDNRTLFWSLQYRGKLRTAIQHYAFAHGLMMPEDFGTMTHWYSRTPEDFLEKMNPPFLPQTTAGYSEKNGLVWDIRDDKWVDKYWKLTQTAVRDFGEGENQQLLHTIGLGERRCFTNRQDNLNLKIESLKKFLARSHHDYPNAKNLLAGWDFYFTWHPEEVQALVKMLDPKRDIIWDYEGDATRDYRPEMKDVGGNNFTKWGVVGKFPYTYSIFLAFENALDVRANYPLIEKRQKLVQEDPMCVGYVFWPESSHTDTLLLRFFTGNAWSRKALGIDTVLTEFCTARYGKENAGTWQAIWQQVIPLSRLLDWGNNYGAYAVLNHHFGNQLNNASVWTKKEFPQELLQAEKIFDALAKLDWQKTPFTTRDAIDLARTTGDRLFIAGRDDMLKAYHKWKTGNASAQEVLARATALKELTRALADILALHTDYSLAESYDRLNAIETIRNPNFANVLLDNATCGYCLSHQYEAARYWFEPAVAKLTDELIARVKQNDKTPLDQQPKFEEARQEYLFSHALNEMRPTLSRTQENYIKALRTMEKCAHVFTRTAR